MSKSFQILGLPETATPEEVKMRWRELAKRWHPDRPDGDPIEFNTFRKAYLDAHARASEPKPCPACHGSGKVVHVRGFSTLALPCLYCDGTGVKAVES